MQDPWRVFHSSNPSRHGRYTQGGSLRWGVGQSSRKFDYDMTYAPPQHFGQPMLELTGWGDKLDNLPQYEKPSHGRVVEGAGSN